MITVYRVKPHHDGFGEFKRDVDGVDHDGLATVEDYVDFVRDNAPDFEPIAEDDDDYERVRDANGKTEDQDGGTIIGWRDSEGTIVLECVRTS